MKRKTVVISINSSWNILNFRMGVVRALQELGHQVIALAPRDAYSEQLIAEGVEFCPIRMDKHGVSLIRDLRLLRDYWRFFRQVKPDVLLAYTAKPNVYGSLAARAAGVRVINNISGLGTAYIRGGWLSAILSSLYKLALRASSTVFFQNHEDRALFVSKGLVRPAQAQLLPGSGVDLQHFSPVTRATGEPSPAEFTFLLIGRMIRDKGVHEFVHAARLVRKTYPATRFQLLGALDAENPASVPAATIADWVEEGLIEYVGHADDVRPFIAAADCVVLPSYREGLPRSLIEAAAMGKPLIATNVPGCRQVVENDVNGLLCTVRDSGSLMRAMVKMLEAPPENRLAWAAASLERARTDFDERIVIARYLEVIRAAFPDDAVTSD